MRVETEFRSDESRQETQAQAQPLLLSESVRIAVGDYFSRLDGHSVNGLYAMVLSEVERPLIQIVLEHCGHNQSKAAQVLGLSRSTLRKKIVQYGLE